MCYSAMQLQAAKNKFGELRFLARNQTDMFDEKAIFPLQPIAFGRQDPNGKREYLAGQYGLVPPWVTDEKDGPKFGRNCYNARSETVFEKPSFRSAILHQRSVIPVTTFFEFPDQEKPLKHRYRISRKDKQAFWLAGIWEYSKRYSLTSCSVITTTPMDLVSKIHSRSPVILDDDQLPIWLNSEVDQREPIQSFLKPHSSEGFVLDQEDWKPERKKKK